MKINCLIVDDEPLSQEVIADFVKDCPELKLAGICNNALEAANILQSQNIDLIFLDIEMPELNGMEAVKQIRRFNPDVYIIAQTAYAQDDYKDTTLLAGCNEYIEKPVDRQKLMKLILKGVSNN